MKMDTGYGQREKPCTRVSLGSGLDQNKYETGIKVSDEEMARLNLQEAKFHGEWNYRILPLNN